MIMGGDGASESGAIHAHIIRASDVLAELVDIDGGHLRRNGDQTASSLAQRQALRRFGAMPLLQTGRRCENM